MSCKYNNCKICGYKSECEIYKENAELEDKLANADYQLEGRDVKIKELETQIEKMRCCQICKHYQWESCNYHSLSAKDCKANNHRLFELVGDKRKMKNERKEKLKDEMKNRISLALKDPILQQGFEIICKENAELKEESDFYNKERGNYKALFLKATLKNNKAREILSKLLEEEKNNMYWEMDGSDKSSYYEVREQAEQFLKDCEVEK